MQYILIITIFLTSSLLANYAHTGKNSGKIDMHGGKKDNLLTNKNTFSNTNLNTLGGMGSIGINKPLMPKKPSTLIKEDTKTAK